MLNLSESERQELYQYIQSVFNYYNGRINIFNPARLVIDLSLFDKSGQQRIACASLPNIVTFYPEIIIKHSVDKDAMRFLIIVTTIHELLHTDQKIDYLLFAASPDYEKEIEDAVQYESYMYAARHPDEIFQNFGNAYQVNLEQLKQTAEANGYLGLYYQRRTYEYQIVEMLRNLMHARNNPTIDFFIKIYREPKSIIRIVFNETDTFTLKDNQMVMPLNLLNDVMYDHFFKYNYRGANVQIRGYDETNTWELHIKTKVGYHLYRIIQ